MKFLKFSQMSLISYLLFAVLLTLILSCTNAKAAVCPGYRHFNNFKSEARKANPLAVTSALPTLTSTVFGWGSSIVSSSEGCGFASKSIHEQQQEMFVYINLPNITIEASTGQGDYIHSLATLFGCPVHLHQEIAEIFQESFEDIYATANKSSMGTLNNFRNAIIRYPRIADQCEYV